MTARLALPYLLTLAACASSTAMTPSDVPPTDAPLLDTAAPDADAALPDARPDIAPDAAADAPRDLAADLDPCGGLTVCDGVCRDTAFDARHCGRCNNACAPTQECVRGACVMAPCVTPLVACAGDCVDTSSDNLHCGACGCRCPPGAVCSGGNCVVGCAAGLTACGRTTCGGEDAGPGAYCVDPQTDTRNCGRCGEVCPDGQLCSAGRCVMPCASGFTLCSSTCRDLQTDLAHCGLCGNACSSTQTCTAGRCVPR
jgi:hypothetical protein